MRKLALAVALVFGLGAAGCYGSFQATRKIHHFNGGISGNGFVNSIVMWAMFVIPIYELGFLGDLIIFNPLQVLTGKNPLR